VFDKSIHLVYEEGIFRLYQLVYDPLIHLAKVVETFNPGSDMDYVFE